MKMDINELYGYITIKNQQFPFHYVNDKLYIIPLNHEEIFKKNM